MATKAQQEELARLRESLKVFSTREAELARELGEAPVTDLASKHREEDEGGSLFERMTSKELMELYETDRPRWQGIMDSVQSAGERKLAKLSARPIGQ